jgi:hypothetical protein
MVCYGLLKDRCPKTKLGAKFIAQKSVNSLKTKNRSFFKKTTKT